MTQMRVACVCGFVGEVEATADATCPTCARPVRSGARLHTENVEAARQEWGLLVVLRTRNVKLVDSEQIQRIVFDLQPDAPIVVIDLRGVEVMGSSALSVLVRVSMERRIGLVHGASRVLDTVRAMGLDSYLPAFESIDAAVAALR
jgi:anti-anti-sigma factor